MHRLPVDVLLHILSFCRLRDSLCLSLVSKSLHALSTVRTYWITALQNERRFKPIACTHNEDLARHGLDKLRSIALHTLRLEQNWTSDQPRIIGRVKRVMLGLPRRDTLFQIPGTWFYVFHCPETGLVELWDADGGEGGGGRMVGEAIEVGRNVWDVSPGEDLPGKFSMGLLVASEAGTEYRLVVICVEYGGSGQEERRLSSTLDAELGSAVEHWAVFLDPQVVGALCYAHGAMLCITAINRRTGQRTFITTDLPNKEVPLDLRHITQSGTAMVQGDLCIIFAEIYRSRVFTLPRRCLPTQGLGDHVSPASQLTFQWGTDFALFPGVSDENDEESESIHPNVLTANDTYGVLAVSLCRWDIWTLNDEGEGQIRQELGLTAWVAGPRAEPWTGTGIPNNLVPLPLQEAIPGTLQDPGDPEADTPWLLIVQTLSGRKSLLLTRVAPEGGTETEIKSLLRLVHCEPDAEQEEEKMYYCDVEVPSDIDLTKVHGLFLDDHVGVVSMVDMNGVLYGIPFA